MKNKTKHLVILMLGTLLITLAIANNKVYADLEVTEYKYSAEDFIFEDRYNLKAENLKLESNATICYSISKVYDFMNNETLLKQNVEKDNYVYDYLYMKAYDITASAVVGNSDSTKYLEKVDKNNTTYFKIPIPIAKLVNNEFEFCGDSFYNIWFRDINGTTVAMQGDNQLTIGGGSPFQIIVDLNRDSKDVAAAYILFASNSYDKTIDELTEEECSYAAFDATGGSIDIDREYAKGNCYMVVYSTLDLGKTITVKGFGNLDYVGKKEQYYQYVAQITDKSIFNSKEAIHYELFGKNVYAPWFWSFHGDLVDLTEKTIETTNTTTNIKLSTDTNIVPQNTVLESKKIEDVSNIKEALKEISTKFVAYDITLKSNNVAIQPNGKVKISIPIPEDYDKTKLLVYRVADNGEKIEYSTKIEENYATIETDHFSTYVLAENNVSTTTNENETQETTSNNTVTTNNTKGEKDNTPKTGSNVNNAIAYVGIITIISILGIIILKKKN